MKQTFYYADYDLTVTIEDGKSGFLKSVSKLEMQALQLNLWHGISAFYTARMLYTANAAEFAKRMDEARADNKPESDGG